MPSFQRRTVLSAGLGLAALSGMSCSARAQTPATASAASAASAPAGASPPRSAAPPASTPASTPVSAPVSTPSRTAVSQGDLGPLLVERLRTDGVALAAMHWRQDKLEQGFATTRGELPDQDSLFELGSITKTFTALLLADAVVRGGLKLTDSVEGLLPGGIKLRDSDGEPLRLVDLATHRSGLPRLPSNLQPKAGVADPYADYDWPAMAEFLAAWKPERPRDTRYDYSNLGYGLLGQALAFAADTDYPTLLGRRVLVPLGLSRHVLFTAPTAGAKLLEGHDREGTRVSHWHFKPAMAGAGALLGSLQGVSRYAQAALGRFDHPLKEAFALCLRRHGALAPPLAEVGLAWQLGPVAGRTLFNHDGGTLGFSTSLWLDPVRQEAAAVLSNAAVGVRPLALHLIEPSQSAHPPPPPPIPLPATLPPVVAVPAEQLAVLAGVYAFTPEFKLTVRSDGTRLFARATGQSEFEIFPMAPRRFFARVTALEIAFDGDEGRPAKLQLFQGGITRPATRE